MDDLEVARLIGLLDDDSTEVAEEAKAGLMSLGPEVVQPLAAAVESLQSYGQLSAIEVFEHFGDDAAGPVLIRLLDIGSETVRDWSAWAVAKLGVREAVPALRAAYGRQRARGGALDDSEAVALRYALTMLGARHVVMPPLTASLRIPVDLLDWAWPSARLADVINDLADHHQVVLHFQLWMVTDNGIFRNDHERLDQSLSVGATWGELVAVARESALVEAAFVKPQENLLVTIEWLDRADA
jgi:hypothetical protein